MMFRSTIAVMLIVAAGPAAAQLAMPPEEERPPSRLAPLDSSTPWYARFETVAGTLASALARGGSGEDWLVHFGGQWLNPAERARIGAILADEALAFRQVFSSRGASEHVILGWQPTEGGDAYAALADRPEGDAMLCWRRSGSAQAWPQTAAEAEDRRAHACVRVSYSVRFDPPQWRAFLDAPVD